MPHVSDDVNGVMFALAYIAAKTIRTSTQTNFISFSRGKWMYVPCYNVYFKYLPEVAAGTARLLLFLVEI